MFSHMHNMCQDLATCNPSICMRMFSYLTYLSRTPNHYPSRYFGKVPLYKDLPHLASLS